MKFIKLSRKLFIEGLRLEPGDKIYPDVKLKRYFIILKTTGSHCNWYHDWKFIELDGVETSRHFGTFADAFSNYYLLERGPRSIKEIFVSRLSS